MFLMTQSLIVPKYARNKPQNVIVLSLPQKRLAVLIGWLCRFLIYDKCCTYENIE